MSAPSQTLNSPFGNRATDLKDKVPGESQQQGLFDDILSAPTPDLGSNAVEPGVPQPPPINPQDLQAPPQEGQGGGFFDDIIPEAGAAQPTVGGGFVPGGAEAAQQGQLQVRPEGGPSIKEQIGEAFTRIRSSFARTTKERKQVLEEKFGEGNVKLYGDTFMVKRPGDKKFTKFDRDDLEVIGDLLDFSREITEEAVAAPAEAAGALLGGPAGFVAGRAGGAVLGNTAADFIAEKALGIERDPERSRFQENAIAAGVNTVVGAIGTKAFKALRNSKSALKNAIPERQLLSRQSKELENISKELSESGLIQNIPGTDTPIMLHQLHPDSPNARSLAKGLANSAEFRQAQQAQGELFEDALNSYVASVKQVSRGAGLPDSGSTLPKNFADLSDQLRRAEGAEIGRFKMQARAKIPKGTKLPLSNNTVGEVTNLMQQMGFRFQAQGNDLQILKPKVDEVLGVMNLSTPGAARNFIGTMDMAARKLKGNGLTLDEFDQLINVLESRRPQAKKVGGQFGASFDRILSGLRDGRRQAIKSGLDPESAKLFDSTMDRFGELAESQNTLARVIENDQLTTNAFVKQLFDRGKDNLEQIRSAKSLLRDHPEAWGQMSGQWLESKIARFGGDTSAFLKHMRGFDPEFMEEVFGGTGGDPKVFMDLLKFGDRIYKTRIDPSVDTPGLRGLLKSSMQFVADFKFMNPGAMAKLFGLDGSNADQMAKILSSDGITEFLDTVPMRKRKFVMDKIDTAIKYARLNGFVGKQVARASELGARAGIRGGLRTEAVQTFQPYPEQDFGGTYQGE